MPTENPIDKMSAEQNEYLIEMEKVQEIIQQSITQGFDQKARQVLQKSVHHLYKKIRERNYEIEKALLPILEPKVSNSAQLMIVRAEHRQMWAAMDMLTEELNHQPDSQLIEKYIHKITELTSFIKNLVEKNLHRINHIIYPLARETLNQDDLRLVSQRLSDSVPPPFS